MSRLMKILIITGMLILVSGVFTACTTTRIDTGHIGVKVKLDLYQFW